MTNQEVFDKVAEHLLTQKEQSAGKHYGSCRYLMTNNEGKELKCAVGCLIPSEIYSPSMEGFSVGYLLDHFSAIVSLFEGVDRKLLGQLQHVHDSGFVVAWKAKLELLGKQHGLNTSILEKF